MRLSLTIAIMAFLISIITLIFVLADCSCARAETIVHYHDDGTYEVYTNGELVLQGPLTVPTAAPTPPVIGQTEPMPGCIGCAAPTQAPSPLPNIEWTSPTTAKIHLCPDGYYPKIDMGGFRPNPYETYPDGTWNL